MLFLADMGVSMRVVDWLRQQSHDVVHLRDRQLQRLPNGDIFQLAAQEHRIVLTFDLDFGEIYFPSTPRFPGFPSSSLNSRIQMLRKRTWSP